MSRHLMEIIFLTSGYQGFFKQILYFLVQHRFEFFSGEKTQKISDCLLHQKIIIKIGALFPKDNFI